MRSRTRIRALIPLAAFLLAFPPARAQDESGDGDGARQSVARVSYFEGTVSFNRGDDPDDWQPASINYPMTLGDRIWAGSDGRVEIQLRGGTVYLGPGTDMAVLDLTGDVRQLSLTLGTASLRLSRLEPGEVFEVATPNVSVTFETPGVYRIDVDEDGNSRASVYQGRAYAAAAGGQVELERGDQVRVRGIDRPDYDVVGLARADGWDQWVEKRARLYRSVRSASYVNPEISGAGDLDAYGSWENVPDYGAVWFPTVTSAGWEPYRAGRWTWRDPWGWTWLSSEPWGWAPYHYGRWAVVRSRWCWVPVGPRDHYPGYSPAIVGFVGGGPGWSVSVSAGGFVGWFPLGPREPFDPWWSRSRSAGNVAGFQYAYRGRATVVARDVFVRGGRVDRDVVRDARIVREVSAAPVLRGPIPVLPTRESIRVIPVGVEARAATRPPEQVRRREVVTRTAPPPVPPSFDRKLQVIREKGGEPVPTDVARRLSTEENRGEKPAQPVRPAAREGVLLSPRGDVKESRQPQPLTPTASRPPVPAVRPTPVRDEAPPATRAPEPRREAEPARPTAGPRRVDVPAPRPVRERAAEPDVRREPAPTRAVPEARPAPSRPPERTFDRPAPVPTPKAERVQAPKPEVRSEPAPKAERAPAPEPRVERTEPRAVRSEPASVEPARPARVEPKKAEPDRAGPKPKPTPAAQKAKPGRERPDEPDKKKD